ncbi:MAG: zinc-ribbon domain-containing protein [Clostridia bacterium]|nr:zinc-ribbon domain-containing protein [Clostridia bacterium]
MNKCTNCGAMFDGKYCPECGTKFVDEKICPECGHTLKSSVKFCPECGYAFKQDYAQKQTDSRQSSPNSENEASKAPPPNNGQHASYGYYTPSWANPIPQRQTPSQTATRTANAYDSNSEKLALPEKIFMLLRYLPAVLSMLFGALLFAFHAADVATVSFFGASEGIGNVYTLISDAEYDFGGVMITLIVFSVIALIYAIATCIVTFKPSVSVKTLGKIRLTDIFAVGTCVVYFLFLILGIIIAGSINSTDGGIGMLKLGACPILIIVFSAIFVILQVGGLTARYLLVKRFSSLADREMLSIYMKLEKSQTAKSNSENNDCEQSSDEKVSSGKTSMSAQKQIYLISKIKCLVRRSDFCMTIAFGFLSVLVPIVGMFICMGKKPWDWNPAQIRKDRKRLMTFAIVFPIVGLNILSAASWIHRSFDVMRSYGQVFIIIIVYLLFIAAFYFIGFIIALCTMKPAREIATAFYGTPNPYEYINTPLVSMSELRAIEQRRTAGTINVKKPLQDILYIVVTTLVIAAVVTVGIVSLSLTYGTKFRAAKVSQIELGAGKTQVEKVLGTPDKSGTGYYEYYSDNYKNHLKKSEELEKKMEAAFLKGDMTEIAKLTQKQVELETELQELTYKIITITFDMKDAVQKVVFDAQRSGKGYTGEKYDPQVTLSQSVVPILSSPYELKLSAKITYDDGSFVNAYVPSEAFSEVNLRKAGTYTLEWHDYTFYKENSYGSLITADITVSAELTQKVTYSFDTNGGSTVSSQTATVLESLPFPAKSNFYFAGWYESSKFDGGPVSLPYRSNKDVTLYAKWTSSPQLIYTNDSAYPFSEKTAGAFRVFSSSNTAVESSSHFTVSAPANAKIVLSCEVSHDRYSSLTVTHRHANGTADTKVAKINDSTGTSVKTFYLDMSAKDSLAIEFKVTRLYGYDDLSIFYASFAISGEFEHTYEFDSNGGNMIESVTGFSLETLPFPTRNGYYFAGWYESKELSGTPVSLPFKSSSDKTLYAKWTTTPQAIYSNDANYPFRVQSGDFTSTNKVHGSSSTYTLTVPKTAKVTFEYGVSSESVGDYFTIVHKHASGSSDTQICNISGTSGSAQSASVDMAAGDKLTFTYSKDESTSYGYDCGYVTDFTVLFPVAFSFDSNGGSTIESVTDFSLETLPIPTKNNYIFAGWYESSSLSGKPVVAPYANTKDIVLYAKWVTAETATSITNNSWDRFTVTNNTVTSTNKGHSSSSSYTITALAKVTVSFEYTVSSENGGDYFTIVQRYADDNADKQLAKISGTNNSWRTATVTLDVGDSIVFTYSKDSSTSSGNDCGSIRNITVSQPTA